MKQKKTFRYKVLMHAGVFVDSTRLQDGIYMTKKPYLYDQDETIENLIQDVKEFMYNMNGMNDSYVKNYIKNVLQCVLVDVELKMI